MASKPSSIPQISNGPATLSVVLNNVCNLSCSHCYLQVERLVDKQLSEDSWLGVLTSAAESGATRLITLAGKEVFADRKSIEVLRRFSSVLSLKENRPRFGMITNGTLVHRDWNAILGSALDYLDISVDGTPEVHDALRGCGAHSAMTKNLPPLLERFGRNLFSSLTLHKANLPTLRDSFVSISSLGFSTIGIGFFRPLPYNDAGLSLSADDYATFFSTLDTLDDLPIPKPLNLLVELDLTNVEALNAFIRSPWFDADSAYLDGNGELIQERDFASGVRVQFRLNFTPSLVNRSARLTPEGLYLAGDDTLDTRLYPFRALATVARHGADFHALHTAAASHPRLVEIQRDYQERLWPNLRNSLGESMLTLPSSAASTFASAETTLV